MLPRILLLSTLLSTATLLADSPAALFEEKKSLDDSVWKQEQLAQKHEEAFVNLWDTLRGCADPLSVLKSFDVGTSIRWGDFTALQTLDHGITLRSLAPDSKGSTTLTPAQWHAFLDQCAADGHRLSMTEWHHRRFELKGDQPPESIVAFTIYLDNEKLQTRITADGTLRVIWKTTPDAKGVFMPARLELATLDLLSRTGKTIFQNVGTLTIPAKQRGPILASDLDHDGRTDLVLPGSNQIAYNTGSGYEPRPLTTAAIAKIHSGNLADFNHDGRTDLIIDATIALTPDSRPTTGLHLLAGQSDGTFSAPVPLSLSPVPSLLGPTMMTSGDIDGDGDIDLFIGVYKEPYKDGSMPTPYYDSNDGYPSFLLLNQGDGLRFTEETDTRGLSSKRHRRVYSASFFDHDGDRDLDLVTVSDFSGIDLYRNDGKGHFTDITATAFKERSLFGMSHAIADFNHDGLPDIYATGMSSTTAARLHAMGARRPDHSDRTDMRIPMTYGNRLYLSQPGGTYVQPDYNREVARTGWAWGTIAADFDNNSRLELYIANGHDSKTSAWDYCSSYWTDDIYRGASISNPIMNQYFTAKIDEKAAKGVSWNGFEKNALFMPMTNGRHRNISWLADVALEADSRIVLTDDIDNDGRLDLIVDHQPNSYDPTRDATTISIFRNRLPAVGQWIGVRLHDQPGAPSPIGAKITVTAEGKKHTAFIVNGDSFKAQHALTQHFGLGTAKDIDSIEITWLDGTTRRLEKPAVNQYHSIKAKP